ncbi:MAG: ATP-binding cassette domain-containing protein [Clostridia bacterium]|nr:ATP-binding cassette domain-containing protein [Clostridia bacterium]
MSYIVIENVTKTIKNNLILDNINLLLEKNKIYGFVGINGSGKTMLFRAIAGLIGYDNGSVKVDGTEIKNGVHPKKTGLLIENADLWMELTAMENMKILNRLSTNTISDEKIEEILTYFGLDPKSKKPYKAFSLGMKQKLRISQAFMGEPELIILDEPTNALDENSIIKLREYIIDKKKKGATILLASHSRTEIELLCDEIIFMDEGKITKLEKVVK